MKNIRGQARRGQEGLEAKEKEKERENGKRRERKREKGRDRQKTHLAVKDRFPEGESALLSLSSRLSKDVSFILFFFFVFFLSLAFNV